MLEIKEKIDNLSNFQAILTEKWRMICTYFPKFSKELWKFKQLVIRWTAGNYIT